MVQSPLAKFPLREPRGPPGLRPPWSRHRFRPRIAGHRQEVAARVLAPQRGARRRFSRRVSAFWFMGSPSRFLLPPHTGTSSGATPVPLGALLLGDIACEPRLRAVGTIAELSIASNALGRVRACHTGSASSSSGPRTVSATRAAYRRRRNRHRVIAASATLIRCWPRCVLTFSSTL